MAETFRNFLGNTVPEGYWTKQRAQPSTPFYTPGGGYGADQNWMDTPIRRQMDQFAPQGVYEAWLGNKGLGGFDAQGQFARGLYNRFGTGYMAAQRENPELSFERYLRGQTKARSIENMWAGLSPGQRGENPSLYAPRTRIIRQG